MAHEAITLHHRGPRETDSWSRSSAARDELQLCASKLNGGCELSRRRRRLTQDGPRNDKALLAK
jgi:hypothetical protein